MKNTILPLSLVVALAASAGCQALQEPVCDSQQLAPIVQATGPRTATVNQLVSYALRVKLGNSCGTFDTLVVSTGNNKTGPITQQIGARGHYVGCSCQTDTVAVTTATYQFKPSRAGTYYIQFLSRQSRFLVDTLVVQ